MDPWPIDDRCIGDWWIHGQSATGVSVIGDWCIDGQLVIGGSMANRNEIEIEMSLYCVPWVESGFSCHALPLRFLFVTLILFLFFLSSDGPVKI